MTTQYDAPAPGWYADREDASKLRWWDGKAWTDQRAPRHVSIAQGWYPDPERPGAHRWWDGSGWTAYRLEAKDAPAKGSGQGLIEQAWRQVRDARKARRLRDLHGSVKLILASVALIPLSLFILVVSAVLDAVGHVDSPAGQAGQYKPSGSEHGVIGLCTFLIVIACPLGLFAGGYLFARFAAFTSMAGQESPAEEAERLNAIFDRFEAEERARQRLRDREREEGEAHRREAEEDRARQEARRRMSEERRRREEEAHNERTKERQKERDRHWEERAAQEEAEAGRRQEKARAEGRRAVFSDNTDTSAFLVLGLDQSATKAEIRKRLYDLTKQYHPDGGNKDTDLRMREVGAAMASLKAHHRY